MSAGPDDRPDGFVRLPESLTYSAAHTAYELAVLLGVPGNRIEVDGVAGTVTLSNALARRLLALAVKGVAAGGEADRG